MNFSVDLNFTKCTYIFLKKDCRIYFYENGINFMHLNFQKLLRSNCNKTEETSLVFAEQKMMQKLAAFSVIIECLVIYVRYKISIVVIIVHRN